jgi:hypothetical protein
MRNALPFLQTGSVVPRNSRLQASRTKTPLIDILGHPSMAAPTPNFFYFYPIVLLISRTESSEKILIGRCWTDLDIQLVDQLQTANCC